MRQTRISEWKKVWPGTTEIAYSALEAGLPVLETIAEIERKKTDCAPCERESAVLAETEGFDPSMRCLRQTPSDATFNKNRQ
jgi:hypothetical protein